MSGLLQLHFGVLLLGGAGLFAKLIDLSAVDITAYRALFAIIFLAFLIRFKKQSLRFHSKKDALTALLIGTLAAVHWVTYFYAIQLTTVAVAMLALFTYPMMTVFLEPLFRKKVPDGKDMLIGLVVLFGVAMLFPDLWFGEGNMSADTLLGIGLGLLSAFCFALRNILVQHKFCHYSGPQSMFFQFLVTAILLLPITDVAVHELDVNTMMLLILCAVVFSACAHALFASGITATSAKTASLVGCLQPVYGILFAFLILAEVPALATIGGGSIILAAAIYETRSTQKQSKAQAKS